MAWAQWICHFFYSPWRS